MNAVLLCENLLVHICKTLDIGSIRALRACSTGIRYAIDSNIRHVHVPYASVADVASLAARCPLVSSISMTVTCAAPIHAVLNGPFSKLIMIIVHEVGDHGDQMVR